MSNTNSQVISLDIRRYLRALRRGWPWIVGCTLLGLLAAGGLLALKPTQATATTLVNINVVTPEPFNAQRNLSSLIDAQTEVQTVRSSAVVSRAAEKIKGMTAAEVRQGTTAAVEANATVVRVNFQAGSPVDAINGADIVAEQYLIYRGEQANARLEKPVGNLEKRRAQIRDDLQRLGGTLSTAKRDSTEFEQALTERDQLNTELDNVSEKLSTIIAIDTSGGSILTSAADLGAVVTPNRTLSLATGLIVGFLLGLVVAFFRVLNSRKVREAVDVDEAGAGPLLAELGLLQASFTDSEAGNDGARTARERMLATLPDSRQVLALIELAPVASATTFPVGVAVAECESGRTVELLLTDPTEDFFTRIATAIDAKRVGGTSRTPRYRSARYRGLYLTRIGRSDGAGDSATELRRILALEDRDVDTTVMAVTASSARSTRLAAARLAQSTILLLSSRHSTKQQLTDLVADIDAVGARITGSIVVNSPRHTGPAAETFPAAGAASRPGSATTPRAGRPTSNGSDPAEGIRRPAASDGVTPGTNGAARKTNASAHKPAKTTAASARSTAPGDGMAQDRPRT
ncbi:MAG: Wzz/FepE/Etk N-terminal domain-containing protein [Nocardioides sp.]